jgi:hypothetical protein
MKSKRLLLVSILCLTLYSASSTAQEPSWNRKVQALAVTPDVAGGAVVSVAYTIDAQATSVPLDLSTRAVLHINGVPAGTPIDASVSFDLVTVDCGASVCSGICGSGTIAGGPALLVCYEDCPWHATPEIDGDCDCGVWRSITFPPVVLTPTDEIMVILRPAPGALPDSEASDDTTRAIPAGEILYWNRGVDTAAMFDVGGGFYDIIVGGDIAYNGPETVNLDFDIVVRRNGTDVATQNVTMRGQRSATDPTCFQVGCGNYCGVINGSSRSCLPGGPWNVCSCTAGFLEVIPSVPMPNLQPNDEIMVLLRPAPGAFPELPSTELDETLIVAHPQPETALNRKVQNIAVTPAPGGGWDVAAHWTADAQLSSVPLNLSTQLELRVNGTPIATSPSQNISFNLVTASCGVSACAGSCGDATIEGGAAALLCYEDCPWHATPGIQDCDCGVWLNYQFPTVPTVLPNDEIMVLLRPAPGALPDSDTSDDAKIVTFDGGEIFWNRAITGVQLTYASGGLLDVEVIGNVTFAGQETANLDFDLVILRNGVEEESRRIETRVLGGTDISCFQLGCGNYCGTVDGLDRDCDPSGPWGGCRCGANWIELFPGVLPGAHTGDEIMVLLRPAPGALPELPGLPEDDDSNGDGRIVGVGDDDARATPRRLLAQNTPNPFNPSTSISFFVPERTRVTLEIFDVQGKRVHTMVNQALDMGLHARTWDGVGDNGLSVASGIYYYRLTVAGHEETRKMVLVK